MNGKERILKILAHQEADRVPIDFWAEKSVISRLMQHLNLRQYEQLLQYLHVDTRYVEGARYTGPERFTAPDGRWEDIWGVVRQPFYLDETDPSKGQIQHVVQHPLARAETVKDVESHRWPSPAWYAYTIREDVAGKEQFAVVCGADRLNRTAQFKPAMYLRGIEQLLTDLTLNPQIVEAITERLITYYIQFNDHIFRQADGKIDLFYMGDDFGTQTGLFMSIEMWRRFFKAGFKRFIDHAHSYGIKVMHHTCGSVVKLIPDFIDCGLDILQSLQPRAKGMDFKKIKSEYGRYIAFQGGIDIQDVMPFGTVDDVKKEVRRVVEALAPEGGYILCSSHNLQPDTSVQNILAMYETALEVGRYPLQA